MPQRFIRFKEYRPFANYSFELTEEQHAETDGSLPHETIRMRADGNGFIMSGNDIAAESTIVWAGDSVIESSNLPETTRVCSVLERKLLEIGKPTLVLNGGYSGATLLHTINVTLNKIVPIHPKILIVSTGPIDHNCCIRERSFWSSYPYVNPLVTAEGTLPDEKEPLIPYSVESRTSLMYVLKSICDTFRIRLFLTTIAHKSMNDPWSKRFEATKLHSSAITMYQAINTSILEFCATTGCGCIDLEAELRNRDELFYDNVHFNVEGSVVVAEFVRRHIEPLLDPVGSTGRLA